MSQPVTTKTVRVKTKTHDQLARLAGERRMSVTAFVQTLVDCWSQQSPNDQDEIVRRPAKGRREKVAA